MAAKKKKGPKKKTKAREVRLEHREILIRQAAGQEFGRFRLCCSKKQTERYHCWRAVNSHDVRRFRSLSR